LRIETTWSSGKDARAGEYTSAEEGFGRGGNRLGAKRGKKEDELMRALRRSAARVV
jgi:hypothetical protein